MKTEDNKRWRLQIRFNNNGDLHWFRTWDIMEDFKQLLVCEEFANSIIDNTVSKARIVDKVTNKIIDLK